MTVPAGGVPSELGTYVQTPSHLWVPPRAGSFGDEVNDVGRLLGIPADPTQERDVDLICSYGEDGRWLTLETCLIEGRQNGKTKSVLLRVVMGDIVLGLSEPDRTFWTAHLMKTTLDTFTAIKMLIEENSLLSKRVKKVREENGDEGIDFHNGNTLDFIARSKGGGRGLSGKRGIFDETLFLEATFMGALIPTLSSRDNPQINYGSSAGNQKSTQLRSLQKRGRNGNDDSLTFIEYRSPGSWDDPPCARGIRCTHIVDDPNALGCCFDDESYWRKTNHSMAYGRMRPAFVRAERRALCQTPEGVLEFGRERMGWEELESGVFDPDRIPRADWVSSRNEKTIPVGEICIAVDIPPSGDRGVIAVAGINQFDKIHMGIIDYKMGTGWIVPRLAELQEKHELMCGILWQPDAPVGALKNQLSFAGIQMEDVTAVDFSKHCGSFKTHITSGDCQMRPSGLLDSAFDSAERRVSVEGAWRWDRRKGGDDISPLCAVTMAVGGVDEFGRRDPNVLIF